MVWLYCSYLLVGCLWQHGRKVPRARLHWGLSPQFRRWEQSSTTLFFLSFLSSSLPEIVGPAHVGGLLGFTHVYPNLALATWSVLFRWGSGKKPTSFFSSPLLLALVVVSRAPTLARGVTNDSQLGNYISNISWSTLINFFVLALTKGSFGRPRLGLLLVGGTY